MRPGCLLRGAPLHLLTGRAPAPRRAPAAAPICACATASSRRSARCLAPQPGERVIDARGCVIYPGWVNTHHHLFQSLLKGIPAGINLALVPWLAAVPVRYRRLLRSRARAAHRRAHRHRRADAVGLHHGRRPPVPLLPGHAVRCVGRGVRRGRAARRAAGAVPRRPDGGARDERCASAAAVDARNAGRLLRLGRARRAALPRRAARVRCGAWSARSPRPTGAAIPST